MKPLSFDCSIDAGNEKTLFKEISDLLFHLRPNWDQQSLKFNKFTNGITNTVLSVENVLDEEKIVFRIYGNSTEKIIDREAEIRNFELLNKFDIAPQIYAKFRNGFAVGHLPGETLTTSNVRDPEIIQKVCQEIAAMHKIPIDDIPETPFLFSKSQQFLDNIPAKFSDEKKQREYEEYFGDVDFEATFCVLKSLVSNVKQDKQVLCHNDLLINNLLYDSERVRIIDYEYTATNYQLFDIANHFNEWAGVDEVNFDLCPNEEEKRYFLETYFKFYLERDPTTEEIDQVLSEIPVFEAASHAFWAVWALVQAGVSTIEFDYLGYASKRLNECKRICSVL